MKTLQYYYTKYKDWQTALFTKECGLTVILFYFYLHLTKVWSANRIFSSMRTYPLPYSCLLHMHSYLPPQPPFTSSLACSFSDFPLFLFHLSSCILYVLYILLIISLFTMSKPSQSILLFKYPIFNCYSLASVLIMTN